MKKGSVSVLKVILWIFKEAHVKFQAERVADAYMLWNLEVTVGRLQLSSASRSEVVEQSEMTMASSSVLSFTPKTDLDYASAQ